jgi:hypothetical protein
MLGIVRSSVSINQLVIRPYWLYLLQTKQFNVHPILAWPSSVKRRLRHEEQPLWYCTQRLMPKVFRYQKGSWMKA